MRSPGTITCSAFPDAVCCSSCHSELDEGFKDYLNGGSQFDGDNYQVEVCCGVDGWLDENEAQGLKLIEKAFRGDHVSD